MHLFQPGLIIGGVQELAIGQEISHVERRVRPMSAIEIHQREPARGNPNVFGFEISVGEGRGLLGESRVQLLGAIK